MLHVVRHHSPAALRPYRGEWDALARGVPFRRFDWLLAWWRHYGAAHPRRELFVICILDEGGRLVGVAPWYVENSPLEGRVIRFLGVDEICSDYMAVLASECDEPAVAEALAGWLTAPHASLTDWLHSPDGNSWDVVHLEGVDAEDRITRKLIEQLVHRGHAVHEARGPNCWRLPLGSDWDALLARMSKARRKHLRRTQRRMDELTGLVKHYVTRPEELDRGLEVLALLHQARWRQAGEPGRFGSSAFAAFHREVAPELMRRGELCLLWLELDGRPLAADYHLLGHDVLYAYQGGVDPERLDVEPGHMALCTGIDWALRRGLRAFDFLRGDEPYKASWGAAPRPSLNLRVVAPHATSRVRHTAWWAGTRLKSLVKDTWCRFRALTGPATAGEG